jgi:hypothetical protein
VEHNWHLQVLASLAMVFLLIKLCVVTGAPLFTLCGLCFSFAWLAVQALLLLVYWKEWTDVEVDTVIAQYRQLERTFSNWYWMPIWTTLNSLLLCGLACFGFFGGSEASKRVFLIGRIIVPTATALALLEEITVVLFLVGSYLVLPVLFLPVLLLSGREKLEKKAVKYVVYGIASTSFLIALCGILVSPALILWSCWDSYCELWHEINWDLGIVDFITVSVCLIIIAKVVYVVGYGFEKPLGLFERCVSSGVNLSVFAIAMAFYLYNYDSRGTYRPSWLDWIGM